jgi:hypothetical protein
MAHFPFKLVGGPDQRLNIPRLVRQDPEKKEKNSVIIAEKVHAVILPR